MNSEWIIRPPWPECDAAARQWGVPRLVAQILHNRDISDKKHCAAFLSPSLMNLHPPDALPGAAAAAGRIVRAVRDSEPIVLYGDYDVDGITGVAILWHVLRLAGANASFYIPHRVSEGYGLNQAAIQSLIEEGVRLIITVDCGVTAVDEAKRVAEAGVSMIVTDHHAPGPSLPEGVVLVHPGLDGTYPNPDLCGSGVAFKLAWAVAKELSDSDRVDDVYREFLQEAMSLAALGTVADVVSLRGENRVIAHHGLSRLVDTPFAGLRVLMESSGLANGRVDGKDIGFRLAPRLNAAGRMGHARLAVELLTRADESRSREIVLYLEEQNRQRQSVERKITRRAIELVERHGMDDDGCRAIVLASEQWHVGVVGIAAARLVDRFRRPTVLIALSNGSGQGSCRSIGTFDIRSALEACGEYLDGFGGHPMAAGIRIQTERVEAFTREFTRIANMRLTSADLREKLHIDAEVELSEMDVRSVELIRELGPFGAGNPRPALCTDWVELASEPRVVGSSGRHLQSTFRQGATEIKSIAFGKADALDELRLHRRCRVAFSPVINEFRGRRTAEMDVLDFKFPTR